MYIGGTDGKLYSFGASSGKIRWAQDTGGYVYSSPAVYRRRVYVGSYSGTFYAFDAATGDVAWSFDANGPISGSATIVDGLVYFSTLEERTYALDARNGRQVWTFPDGKYSPLVTDGEWAFLTGYARIFGDAAAPAAKVAKLGRRMTELRTPPSRTLPPDPDDEEEVDLGRYWRAIAARWWLLLAGAVIGILIGYLVSLGSGQVWQATAVLYLGNPTTVGGSNPVQGLQQNPRTVNEIVHSEAAITTAAVRCGMRPGQIRGNVSTKGVSAGRAAARAAAGGGQLVQVTVQGDRSAAGGVPRERPRGTGRRANLRLRRHEDRDLRGSVWRRRPPRSRRSTRSSASRPRP